MQAFKNFCKKAKVKTVADFEARLFSAKPQVQEGGPAAGVEELNSRDLPDSERDLISCKFEFRNAISKCQADLKFNEQMLEFHQRKLTSIETSLEEEKSKLENLRNIAREGAV